MFTMKSGKGEKVSREKDDSRRFRVYMRAGDEKRLRETAKEVGICNQYGEGNISGILTRLASLYIEDLKDLLIELNEDYIEWISGKEKK